MLASEGVPTEGVQAVCLQGGSMKEVVEARATMKVRNFMQGAAIGVLLLSIVVGVLCAIGNDRRKATARGVREIGRAHV